MKASYIAASTEYRTPECGKLRSRSADPGLGLGTAGLSTVPCYCEAFRKSRRGRLRITSVTRRSRELPGTGFGSFRLQCQGGPQGCVEFPQLRESPEDPIDLRVLDGSEVVGHDYRVHQQTRPLRAFAIDPHDHPVRCPARAMLLVIIA